MAASPKPIALALQGGGSHSAFTWGVLDQILLEGKLEIRSVSASSGGAILACILAQGLIEGGSDGARASLLQFWKKVSTASTLMPLRMKVVDQFLGHVGMDFSAQTLALDTLTRLFSPQQFNLFDINPLRGIVEEMVDFSALNKKSPIALHINTTNARTGKSRLFTDKELTLDAVMASSCLPYLFKPVEIDGEHYWDGSYSGCPYIAPLVNEGQRDILLVQVHPSTVEDVPTTAADILDRATEMSFHNLLQQEIKTIDLFNHMLQANGQEVVRLHRIEAQDVLGTLGRASKLNADWEFLVYLHDLGVQSATDWLASGLAAVGLSSASASSAA